jgi:hypothetical protein
MQADNLIKDYLRRENCQMRKLPTDLKAPAWEADEITCEDPETPAVAMQGMNTLQMARYLMLAGRGIKRQAGDNSAYSPITRHVVAFLSSRLQMGYGAMRSFLAENQDVAQACDCWPVPGQWTIKNWIETTASSRTAHVSRIVV